MWSLPSPPSEIHPGSLLQTNILPVSSLFSSYMPPLRPFLCIQPTLLQCLVPPIVRPPLSVRRRATKPPASADQCPLLVSRPSVPYAGLHPPPTYAAGGTWLGCGCVWRGEGDGAPRDGIESVVLSVGVACLLQTRRSTSLSIPAVRDGRESLDSSGRRRPGKRAFVDARIISRVLRCPYLCLPPPHPPPPFPIQPYVYLYSPS